MLLSRQNAQHLARSLDAGTARRIYARAGKQAAGDQELFKKIVAEELPKFGLRVPKKFSSAAGAAEAATDEVSNGPVEKTAEINDPE